MTIHPDGRLKVYKRIGISLAEVQIKVRKTVIYTYYKLGIFWPFQNNSNRLTEKRCSVSTAGTWNRHHFLWRKYTICAARVTQHSSAEYWLVHALGMCTSMSPTCTSRQKVVGSTKIYRMVLPSVDVRTNSSDWLCFFPPAPLGNQCISVGKISAGNLITCEMVKSHSCHRQNTLLELSPFPG